MPNLMGWSGRGECLDVSERNQNFLAASGTIGMAHHAPPLLVPFRSAVTAPQNPGPTPVKEKPRRRHSTAGQVRREGTLPQHHTLPGQNDRLTKGHLWISRHRHQPEINEPIGSATPRPKSAAPQPPWAELRRPRLTPVGAVSLRARQIGGPPTKCDQLEGQGRRCLPPDG